jgi:hypothetical protein
MNILLICANTHREPEPVFPLGPAYLMAALEDGGHEVHAVDLLAGGGEQDSLKKK